MNPQSRHTRYEADTCRLVKMSRSQNMAGGFNFDVHFSNPKKLVKASPYRFSPTLDKLFVQDEVKCPVRIEANINNEQIANFRIRSWVAFADDHCTAVHCCPNHMAQYSKTTSSGIVSCPSVPCTYELVGIHHSVVVNASDLRSNGNGTTLSAWVNYSFTCLNTCPTLKQATELIIALEDSRGLIVGRRTVGLKICKCPGRDSTSAEEKKTSRGRKRKRADSGEDIEREAQLLEQLISDDSSEEPRNKRWRLTAPSSLSESSQADDDDDDEEYTLTVEIPKNCPFTSQDCNNLVNLLLKMYDSYACGN